MSRCLPAGFALAGDYVRARRAAEEHMNSWHIPDWLEREVKERDKFCVYCGIQMIEQMPSRGARRGVATWEHIINDASIVTRENIARCCVACNASKGAKTVSEWIESSYCKKRGINKDTVAEVVRLALRETPNETMEPTGLAVAARRERRCAGGSSPTR